MTRESSRFYPADKVPSNFDKRSVFILAFKEVGGEDEGAVSINFESFGKAFRMVSKNSEPEIQEGYLWDIPYIYTQKSERNVTQTKGSGALAVSPIKLKFFWQKGEKP